MVVAVGRVGVTRHGWAAGLSLGMLAALNSTEVLAVDLGCHW